jgi:hypothetical protein
LLARAQGLSQLLGKLEELTLFTFSCFETCFDQPDDYPVRTRALAFGQGFSPAARCAMSG